MRESTGGGKRGEVGESVGRWGKAWGGGGKQGEVGESGGRWGKAGEHTLKTLTGELTKCL